MEYTADLVEVFQRITNICFHVDCVQPV